MNLCKMKLTGILIFLLVFATCAWPANEAEPAFKITPGEELTYTATWMHFRIATLTLCVCDTLRINNQLTCHTQFRIKSNPLLFFVNVNGVFESWIDKNFNPHLYVSNENDRNMKYQMKYQFDYKARLITVNQFSIIDTIRTVTKQIPFDDKIFDGTSLIFYIRNRILKPGTETLTLIEGGETKELQLTVKGQTERVKCSALKNVFDTVEVEGNSDFVSTGGFSGKFKLWITKDKFRIPLKISMQAFLGHVNLKLESWKQPNEYLVN